MRVAIIYWDPKNTGLKDYASALSKGIQSQDHQVQVFDGIHDDARLTPYDYIIMGTVPQSLMGKSLDGSIRNSLAQCGTLTGKRCFAFVKKKGFRSFRILKELMKVMESEGMMLRNSQVFSQKEEAEYLGSQLVIKK